MAGRAARTQRRGNARLSARAVAARIVLDVNENAVPLFAALADVPTALPERDQSLARAIVRTTVRRRGDIEWVLARLLTKALPRKAGMVRAVLAMSAAQLLFMRQADHAAVSEAVELLKAEPSTGGFVGLANAVLRRLVRERETHLSALPVEANTPPWLFARWVGTYGAGTAAAMAQAHREEPPLDLALAPDGAAPVGAVMLPTGGARLPATMVERIEGYATGGWWVQDMAAQLPALLLEPAAEMRVADLCAAPGGKTMQLAAQGATVTAVELDPSRAVRLRENLARTGLLGRVTVVEGDALALDGTFDAVLLDAPCSATGTLRRQPDVAWSKSARDIGALAKVQRALLAHAAGLLRPGGRLVFATCSLEPEEGEAHLGFTREALPLALEPIVEGPAAAFATADGAMRTLPHLALPGGAGLVGLDGFFAARFRRV
ncbi:MAG: transcription antitermination factor NusB [Pseudomonadota bacterium]